MEISRKNLRNEVLERIKYVKTCVMARELCLLVRTNRAVLGTQRRTGSLPATFQTYAKKKAAANQANYASKQPTPSTQQTKKNTLNYALKAA